MYVNDKEEDNMGFNKKNNSKCEEGNIMESYYDGIPPEIKKMSLEEIEAELERIKNEENELAENEEKNSPSPQKTKQ